MEKIELNSISEELSLRIATQDDEFLILSWRNNPNVRKFSRTIEPIPQSIHAEWFHARLLEIQKAPYFIFQLDKQPVGMVRLDTKHDLPGVFEINILVDESFQNRGFATVMISEVLKFAKENLSVAEIRAFIHKENIQSIKLFKKFGFLKNQDAVDFFQEYYLSL